MPEKRPKAEIEAAIRGFLTSKAAGKAVQRQLTRNYADWQTHVMMADVQLRVMESLSAHEEADIDTTHVAQVGSVAKGAANWLPI